MPAKFISDEQLRAVYELERFYGYTRAQVARLRGGLTGRMLWQRAGYSSEASFTVALSIRYRRLGWR